MAFVDASDIDVLQLDRVYLLAPASAAANKPYVLLRDTLRQTDRVAVGKITLRMKESLALLRVRGDLMAVHTMLWPDEVRDPEGLAPPGSVKVRPQEIEVASGLMERMSKDFDLDALKDSYQVALGELVLSKVEDRPVKEPVAQAAAPSNVVDVMAALQASFDRADEGSKVAAGSTVGKPAAKRAPVKKTAARKTAAKKASSGRKRRTG
ncbi:Ku protein [Streptomyces sp. KLMMK]|uniref:non-homologous end joining protein Ku n=1 Tax=Streptomyces sp. KLMMK TaxID=3109353 RepID=UPI00300817B8